MRLHDCIGPMMQLAEFDDPQKLRTRFEELCRNGVVAGDFPRLPPMISDRAGGNAAHCMSATFQVPAEAPFFADHFPRRPVFPGSLLMHLNLQLGAELAAEIPPPTRGRWVPSIIHDMKLRAFIPPGTTLRFEANLKQRSLGQARLAFETRAADEVIATAGLTLKVGDGL